MLVLKIHPSSLIAESRRVNVQSTDQILAEGFSEESDNGGALF
jgi:hypothetical protein